MRMLLKLQTMGRRWGQQHPGLIIPTLSLFLAFLFAGELLIPGRSLYRWDTLVYNWPVIVNAKAQWLSGHFPFWDDSICCGTPFLENINAGLLYPLRLVCWMLPLKAGYHLFLFIHVWLAFLGMAALLKKGFKVSWFGSLAGAVVYGASGYARGMWDTHNFMALPWIPFGLLALLYAKQPGKIIPAALLTALCWAMMILGGDFQSAVLWAACAGLLCLVFKERSRLAPSLLLALFLGLLLTAPQWLTTALASADSYRAHGIDVKEAVERSFHPLRLLELFLPYAYGNRDLWFGQKLAGAGAVKLVPWITSLGMGSLSLLAILLALRSSKKRALQWALLLICIFTPLSFGRFLPGFSMWIGLPVINLFRYPEKYLLWTTLGLSLLAGFGFEALYALWTSRRMRVARVKWLTVWLTVLVLGSAVAVVMCFRIADDKSNYAAWIGPRMLSSGLVCLAVFFLGFCIQQRAMLRMMLPALLLIDLLLPWYVEHPTTSSFKPLSVPPVAEQINTLQTSRDRVLQDPALQQIPLPRDFATLNLSKRQAILFRETLAFNTPCLWGLSTATGFSPIESSRMKDFRKSTIDTADDGSPPTPDRLAAFCKAANVKWLVTSSRGAAALGDCGIAGDIAASWGQEGETVLLHITNTSPAEVIPLGSGKATRKTPAVTQVWRVRPGLIRVDLKPGEDAFLLLRETYASGWRAFNQTGHPLKIPKTESPFLSIECPSGTTQVRLTYRPAGWYVSLSIFGAGLLLLLYLWGTATSPDRIRYYLRQPAVMAVTVSLFFFLVGRAAQSHWAPTFDEGFHITRGMMWLKMHDSRLSYFHPPLQNGICAWFADNALGRRVKLPNTPAWTDADVAGYSVDFALANKDIYPDLVRASRIGTALFGILICIVGVYWAHKLGGPGAGWLAGILLALNPNLLAHGHLNTTDIGVAAMGFAACYALWRFAETNKKRWLSISSMAFTGAALVKFSGLIWLIAFAFICVPLLAGLKRRVTLLWFIPGTAAFFIAVLVFLYGWEPQIVRTGQHFFLTGHPLVAGRYWEGLFVQGQHALTGHRAYFAGHKLIEASWWMSPAAFAIKTPLPLLVAFIVSGFWLVFRRTSSSVWISLLPVLLFGCLLVLSSKLALGVRHSLSILLFGIVLAVSFVFSLRRKPARFFLAALLGLSTIAAAVFSYPSYLSYYPLWIGGQEGGRKWMVDSNYDWGQDIEILEQHWAEIIEANKGVIPNLVYYGFVDPSVIYRMPVSPASLRGFMQWQGLIDRPVSEMHLQTPLNGTTVISESAMKVGPLGLDFSSLQEGVYMGRIAHSFLVYNRSP